jgi:hypothetical protein
VYNWIIYISSCSKFATWRPTETKQKKHANINMNQFLGGLTFSRKSWIDYVKAEPCFDLALEECFSWNEFVILAVFLF